MKHALLALVLAATTAAAQPNVVAVEVDRDQLAASWSTLPYHDLEPGGVVVPANADGSWFRIGLQVGDIVRYVDGDPVKDLDRLADGLSVLELERGGRRVLLRVMIHGPTALKATISQSNFQGLLDRLVDPDPRVTPVRDKAGPSGVRLVDFFFGMNLELEVGDIVRSIAGAPIRTDAAFVQALRQLPVGFSEIVIDRYGRRFTIEITREAPPDVTTIQRLSATRFDIARATYDALGEDTDLLEHGVETVRLTERGIVTGLRLAKVAPDSLCAVLGLQTDDILLEVEGRSVGSLDALRDARMFLQSPSQITIKLERKRKRIAITYAIR